MPDPASPPLPAERVAQREWPPLRAALLDIAAAMDRLDRAGAADQRKAAEGLLSELLRPGGADRAERLLKRLSRGYDPTWRDRFAAGETDADPSDTAAR